MISSLRNMTVAVSCLLASTVALAGNGVLLGVQVAYPRVNFTEGLASQGAVYNGSVLTITSTPVFLTFSEGGTEEFILGGSLTLSANIDGGGALSGGTFSISGNVTDTATSAVYSGVLLSGTVADYGIIDVGIPGGTDLADFSMNATSGSMLATAGGSGAAVNALVALEGSSFSGSFAASWSADRAKGDIGPAPSVPQLPPHTIGFWKNHPEVWPVTTMVICGNSLNQDELVSVLGSSPRGDVTIIMARQLIASRLNVASGNSCPLTVDAEAWLCSHGGIGASRKKWDGGEELKNALDQFNNGGACSL
jgi:hypothetical protein